MYGDKGADVATMDDTLFDETTDTGMGELVETMHMYYHANMSRLRQAQRRTIDDSYADQSNMSADASIAAYLTYCKKTYRNLLNVQIFLNDNEPQPKMLI